MSAETKRYPTPELQRGGSFYARIPLIDGFESVVGDVESNKELQARLEAYAGRTTGALGLNVNHLIVDERGLTSVSVSGDCACIGMTGDSWEQRGKKLPEFSTHNVDTPEQYIALTSIVFYYLNKLQKLADEKVSASQ